MQCNSKPNMNVKNKISLLDDNSFKNIIETSNTWVDISKKIGYSTVMSSFLKKEVKKRCAQLNLSLNINSNTNKKIGLRTKGEVFNGRKNWQSARGAIRKHALFVYKKSNKPFVCAICGYDKHIDIAHIKAVADFDDDTLISEINDINNLIGLCPNHHWEYDNGLLILESK